MDLGHIFQGRYLAVKCRAGHCLFVECAQWLWFVSFNLPIPTSPQFCFALFAADFLLTYYIACVLCTKIVEAKKEMF